jgi:hypothetical protein
MKRGGKRLVFLAGSVVLCAAAAEPAADAPTNSSPYQAVVERNVFALKPPPPPPDPEANKPALPKIYLTGIITVGGAKRALMKTPPPPGPPAKAGDPPKTEQTYTLAIGQRDGEIEVLEIDEKAGSVKVNYGGEVTELTFEKDGVKSPPTPGGAPGVPPGVAPGGPPAMRAAMPLPRGMPGTGAMPMPQRPLRFGPGTGASMNQSSTSDGLAAASQPLSGGASPSAAGIGANALASSQSTPAASGFNSPEEAALLLEYNRIQTQAQVDAGELPPLPIHPLSEDARAVLLGTADQQNATTTPTAQQATAPAMPRLAPTIPQLPVPSATPQATQ